MTRIWIGLGVMVALEYVWLLIEFLRPRRSRAASTSLGQIYVAGPTERFELNSVTPFPRGKFYLVRLQDGGFLAMGRECTHLGCTVPWVAEDGKFVCPCHASAYDITGRVLSPPAPRPLDLFAVRIENDVVKVDLSRRIQRSRFEADQVTAS